MIITRLSVLLTLLNHVLSKTCRNQECCQNIFLSPINYAVEVYHVRGKTNLHLICSESNSSNIYQYPRNCNLQSINVIYHEFHTYDCSTEEINIFIENYRQISKRTKRLEYNSYTKREDFKISQLRFIDFPKLEEIYLLHAGFHTIGDKIEWPKNFNWLHIYNSNQTFIPMLPENHIAQLFIDTWPNLTNISGIKSFQNLKELTIRETPLTSLPAKIFMKNAKLRSLQLHRNYKLHKLHSDTLFGLNDLTELVLQKNPIISLPSGFFGNAHALKTISWEEDLCITTKNRTLPNDMLKGRVSQKK